ncbi:hypothetical protein K8942_04800 [Candidatus Peribacteria bacterium]|nr:MAG: hypothetical protein K8942_04800 [Candidatus Peribacteria bacterium]
MKRPYKAFLSGEARCIHLFKEVGSNLKTYGKDLGQEYITGPYQKHDAIQMITGPVMAAASVILEGTDQIVAGVLDQKLEPSNGTLGRMRRDGKEFLKDVVTLHPIRAIADGFRLVTSDLLLDVGDAVGGHRMAA